MKEKHAYLIIAHDNFEVLKLLLEELDDSRNDIYLHIDQKVKDIPSFHTVYSSLILLEKRMDVRWGSLSQIECEYLLLREAYNSNVMYDRYHLISGTHYPLKSQDELHDYFDSQRNVEVLSFLKTSDYEIDLKLNHYHILMRYFKHKNVYLERLVQKIWHISLKIQKIFRLNRNSLNVTKKANNWVSLTSRAVKYILSKEVFVLDRFSFTFCADEFFIPFLLDDNVEGFILKNEPNLLYNDFVDVSNPRVLTDHDFDFLVNSNYMFARKFSDSELGLIKRLKHNYEA